MNPKQKEFFDENAEKWDLTTAHDHSKIERILDRIDVREGQRIMDVGTGTGVMIPHYLSRNVAHVTAVDYSPKMIDVARGKFPEGDRLEYRVMDLYDLKDRDAYDRVVCYCCFPHFPDREKAISTLAGTLRMGGTLTIAHPMSRAAINKVHTDTGREEICEDLLPEMSVMVSMMEACGLAIEYTRDDSEYYIAVGKKV